MAANLGAPGLLDRVQMLCGQAASRLPARQAEAVRQAGAALKDPLRLAFVGRVSSGKSTLLNAYLGKRLAPTDEGECTTLVTSVRFGPAECARAVLLDGTIMPIKFESDGSLPSRLGVEADEVQSIEVELSLEILRNVIIIDTPGLNSAHDENSERTRGALGIDPASQAAAATADAIIFVLKAGLEDERDVLRQFRGVSLGLHAAPSNAIGLLAKADEIAADDPQEAAAELAAQQARQLGQDVATVRPVIGLLAETAETRFSEKEAGEIRTLAALGPEARAEMLYGRDYFVGVDAPLPLSRREELYSMLRTYGLRLLLEAADRGAGVTAMVALLRDRSGVAALRDEVNRRFLARGVPLKAAKALAAVSAAAQAPEVPAADRRKILADIDDLLLDPAMHALEELRALSLVSSGGTILTAAERTDAQVILTETGPAARLGLPPSTEPAMLRAAIDQAVGRWSAIANTALSPRSRDAARVITRALELDRDADGGERA